MRTKNRADKREAWWWNLELAHKIVKDVYQALVKGLNALFKFVVC